MLKLESIFESNISGARYSRSEFFIQKMEIVLSLKKFSFYSSNETAYLVGTVFRKTELELPIPADKLFDGVTKNSQINLKYSCSDIEKLRLLFTERLLKIRSIEVNQATDPTRAHTFVANSISPCEL